MATFQDLANKSNVQFGLHKMHLAATTNTNAVDVRPGQAFTWVVSAGASNGAGYLNTTNYFAPNFRESNDNDVANSTNIDTNRIVLNSNITTVNTSYLLGCVPTKNFVFLELLVNGTANANISVTGFVGDVTNVVAT